MVKLSIKLWVIFALLGILTFFFPSIDLFITSLFYKNGFIYASHPFMQFFYKSVPLLTILLGISAFAITSYLFITKQESWKTLTRQKLAIVFLAALLAPGLGASLTKDNFGRARPMQIVQFGGDKNYTSPLVYTNQCEKNCSFVCGHATMAFIFMVLAFIAPLSYQRRIFWSTFLFGLIVGGVRIIQGGHFFSDVIFAFLLDLAVILIIIHLFKQWITLKYE